MLKKQWSNKKKVICVVLSLAIIIGITSIVLVFISSNESIYHEYFYIDREDRFRLRGFDTRDGLAVVWIDGDTPAIIQVATGREIKRFRGGRDGFNTVRLEPGGMVYVTRRFGRRALIDIETGNDIIPLEGRRSIRAVSNGIAIVAENHQLGVIDLKTGAELVPLQLFSSINFTSDTMVELRPHRNDVSNLDWNRGVANIIDVTTGEELPPIPLARYGLGAAIIRSSGGLGLVELLDRSVALIDLKTGDILIPFDEFSEILSFDYGMAAVVRDDEVALIDIASGDEIIPFGRYSAFRILSEDTVAVTYHTAREWGHVRKWGIVDIASGIETVPISEFAFPPFDYYDGIIAVYCNRQGIAVIDTATGETIIPYGRYDITTLLPDGFIAILDSNTRLWRFEKLADFL